MTLIFLSPFTSVFPSKAKNTNQSFVLSCYSSPDHFNLFLGISIIFEDGNATSRQLLPQTDFLFAESQKIFNTISILSYDFISYDNFIYLHSPFSYDVNKRRQHRPCYQCSSSKIIHCHNFYYSARFTIENEHHLL